jgi:hypothetical protein
VRSRPGALGQFGHVATFESQVVFEIQFLEGIARFPQGLVKQRQQRGHFRTFATLFLRRYPAHVLGTDFIFQRCQGKIADQGIKISNWLPAGFSRAGYAVRSVRRLRNGVAGLHPARQNWSATRLAISGNSSA